MRLLRRYDEAGLVHAIGVRRDTWAHHPVTINDRVAVCTKGDLVWVRGPITDDNITCLRCLAMNLVGELL